MTKVKEALTVALSNILSGPNIFDITDTIEGNHLTFYKLNDTEEFKGKKLEILPEANENLIYVIEDENLEFNKKIQLYSLTLIETPQGKKVMYGLTEKSIKKVS